MSFLECRAPWALFLVVVGAHFVGACRQESAPQDESFAGVKKREPARVMTEPVVRREMVRRLETTTRIESESNVQIFARASGVLVELFVEEGDVVTAGQVLARLDDRDAKLRLDDSRALWNESRANLPKLALAVQEAEARLTAMRRSADQATRDHERNRALAQATDTTVALISNKDLEASQLAKDRAWGDVEQNDLAFQRAKAEALTGESAVERARLAVERAELEFSFTRITAPIAGVVAERSIKIGDTISISTLAFTLTDPDVLRAVFFRPQRELEMFRVALVSGSNGSKDSLAAELEILATAEAMPGKQFSGKIERIAPTIDSASGNFRVTARMRKQAQGDPTAQLLPGMLVRLEIITDRHPAALVVPKRALRREGDRSSVFVVRDGKAYGVEVTESFSDDTNVEVIPAQGAVLEPGMAVVVVGNRDLEDGAEVIQTTSEVAPSGDGR